MNNLFFANNENQRCVDSKSTPLPPPKSSNSSKKNPKKKKINFKKIKNNTCNSLNEVECFLNNFHKFTNYIKLYKILK